MIMDIQKSYEYMNEFLFFNIRPEENRGNGTFLYCAGVNVARFLPLTRGRHKPMSNPAIRGLQLISYDVMALAKSNGAIARAIQGNRCRGISPTEELWSRQSLLIEQAPPSLPDKIINHCVVELLRKIDKGLIGSKLGAEMPDKVLKPGELQAYIEKLCSQYGQ
jgi:hypothetical protein